MKKQNTTVVIAFTGPAKVGKDTVGEALHKFLSEKGIRSSLLKFAEPVKDIFSLLYREQFPGGYEESQGFKHKQLSNSKRVRDALVHIGNGMRDFDEDVWVRLAAESVVPNAINIVTDLRYDNEALWVKGRLPSVPTHELFAGWTGMVAEMRRKEIGYSGIRGEQGVDNSLIDYKYTNVKIDELDTVCLDLYQELCRLDLITREMIRPGK